MLDNFLRTFPVYKIEVERNRSSGCSGHIICADGSLVNYSNIHFIFSELCQVTEINEWHMQIYGGLDTYPVMKT